MSDFKTIGTGLYIPCMVTLLNLLVLTLIGYFVKKDRYRILIVNAAEGALTLRKLLSILEEHGLHPIDFAMARDYRNEEITFELSEVQSGHFSCVELTNAIAELDLVTRVRFR